MTIQLPVPYLISTFISPVRQKSYFTDVEGEAQQSEVTYTKLRSGEAS